MSQIAVRLSDQELRSLDAVVASGAFPSRAEAVRAGVRLLENQLRETRIQASYRKGYETPLSEGDTQMLEAAAALAADVPT